MGTWEGKEGASGALVEDTKIAQKIKDLHTLSLLIFANPEIVLILMELELEDLVATTDGLDLLKLAAQ
ncbi:hypothetical protein Nepgr_026891 [Nepenthes gracilis]|uniref:Uncharacterized protein n=1 Tax=Nepenthes gracilis TaxID=150966 RepID=A0AAD3Y0Z6_NEPGR|nr:hypothetical protein Nepgr_026891 [Nepenthes gracilis]